MVWYGRFVVGEDRLLVQLKCFLFIILKLFRLISGFRLDEDFLHAQLLKLLLTYVKIMSTNKLHTRYFKNA